MIFNKRNSYHKHPAVIHSHMSDVRDMYTHVQINKTFQCKIVNICLPIIFSICFYLLKTSVSLRWFF